MRRHPLGIYEKALPRNTSWVEKLALAKSCGFDFVEMSVDENDERLARLDWSLTERMELISAIQQTGSVFRQCACLLTGVFHLVAMIEILVSRRVRLC